MSKDPRIATTTAEFQEQFNLLMRIQDRLQVISNAVWAIRAVTEQSATLAQRLAEERGGKEIEQRAAALVEQLADIEVEFVRVPRGPIMGYQRPKLVREFGAVSQVVSSADARPTDQSYERFSELDSMLSERLDQLDEVFRDGLAKFNEMIIELGIPPVIVPREGGRSNVTTTSGG